jgi:hypothetical protein
MSTDIHRQVRTVDRPIGVEKIATFLPDDLADAGQHTSTKTRNVVDHNTPEFCRR